MQQVPTSDGTICRSVRRHTPEVATFGNIRTAHNLMPLYMGRVCSVVLHVSEIESRFRRDFPHSSRLDLGPIKPSLKWEPFIYPEGKLFGTWRW